MPKVGIRSLWPYLRDHRASLLVVAALSLATTVGTLAQPLLTRDVLDGISASAPIAPVVAALVSVLIIVALLDAVRGYLLKRTAEGLVLTARRSLAGHLLRLPIAEYDARRTGDLLSRVGADTTLLRVVVTSGLFETASGVLMVVGAATGMMLLDPLLFAVTLAGIAIGLSGGLFFARRIRGLSRQAQERIGEMTSAVERAISAARTIRAARAEERETATVTEAATHAYRAGLRIARLESAISPAMSITVQGAFLLVLGVGGARVAAGAITIGDLVAFVLFIFFLVMPLGQAMHAYTQLQAGLGALSRMEEILGVPREKSPESQGDPRSSTLEFDRVGFAYATGGPVLRDVSFTVDAGTRTALVGPSGAGKSTILALMERFYDVTGGAIRLGGVDLRYLSNDDLRSRLGYVEQESPVLAGTIRENLLLGNPSCDDETLMAVLRQVNLDGIVQRSPLGLGAQVGEGGVLLSGGERQRLAIARALLARPEILLLDEPTSNLDARNEAALKAAIETAARGRTVLIVAHRLSTVVDSDQIVVLERGSVVAVGRHDELLTTSPLYRELATQQLLVPSAD
ncbi:MAG TPA: ABC transporter ATP-binding protein [Candidatus Limnocylindrales bacterium]|nr:ABC transporter ATP-binding protein [Candidatus Limnocylindrales bacterium]